jgi:trehalose 6-phosphate phosphatase
LGPNGPIRDQIALGGGILERVTEAMSAEALAPFTGEPGAAAILLDIDGTLAPIVDHASDANVPESTRQLLIAISRTYKLVACVTGRRASEARAMVSIGTITYLGSHGAEQLRPGWTEAVLDPAVAEWGRRIREFGRAHDTAEARRLRVRLEDKGAIVAFHWRGAPDDQAAHAAVAEIAQQAEQEGLKPHWGRKVLEIRPPVTINKGLGVQRLLGEFGDGVHVALYVGDDTTDLDAFRALDRMRQDGALQRVLRVGVASDEGPSEITSEADLVVDGPAGVRELLTLLAAGE